MGKALLVGVIFLAGSLAPLFWLHPWKYSQEKRSVREALRRHPGIALKKFDVLAGRNGLLLELSVPYDQIDALMSLRRMLRGDPVLDRTFESTEIDILNGGWQSDECSSLELRFVFLPRPN